MPEARHISIGVDIGGTFTDVVVIDDKTRAIHSAKVLTTPQQPQQAVLTAVNQMLALTGAPPGAIRTLVHGTTLATNAIIERKGAQTLLLTTKGFRDALETRTELRYDLYDLFIQFPEPLVPRRRRIGITERTMFDGAITTPLSQADIAAALASEHARDIEAVAVCFLHSYANPDNERAAGALVEQALPGIPVTLSCDVLPEIGEYGRVSTTVANAYVQPLIDRYLGALDEALTAMGSSAAFFVMGSNAGALSLEVARKYPVRLVESGPAAGVSIAAHYARKLAIPDLLSFDMGGTTAKIALVSNFEPARASELEVARVKRFQKGSGLLLKAPAVELIEIGAGGGSIATVDNLGLLSVGPESAGSAPGPACYGQGGEAATVTDADVVLGYLNPDYFLGGKMRLESNRSVAAIDRHIARPMSVSTIPAASSIFEVVNDNMANAAAVYASEQGIDLRDHVLLAFGGAAPAHAWDVARRLGISEVRIPFAAGVLSALGCLASPISFDFAFGYMRELGAVDWQHVNQRFANLEAEGRRQLANAGITTGITVTVSADMRYYGQRYEVNVPLERTPFSAGSTADIAARFFAAYQSYYGRKIDDVPVETVSWRLSISGPRPELTIDWPGRIERAEAVTPKGHRSAFFPGSPAPVSLRCVRTRRFAGRHQNRRSRHHRGPRIHNHRSGRRPPPHRPGTHDRHRHQRSVPMTADPELDPVTLTMWWNKLITIVDEAQATLLRTAFSRIVTDAWDFSCALFDAEGRMIAQGRHGLPQFTGCMSFALPDFLAAFPPEALEPGDSLITTDPWIGASQINDVFFMTPIFRRGRIVAYAMSVSHSPDVGGRLLSADSKEIFEEGFRLPVIKLYKAGQPNEDLFRIIRMNVRVPDIVIGDLEAQLAANTITERRLQQFMDTIGRDDLDTLFEEVWARSDRAMAQAIEAMPDGIYRGEVETDGFERPLKLCCEITINGDQLHIDCTGSSPQDAYGINTTRRWSFAEAAFGCICVARPASPVNGATLRRIEYTAPEGSVINATFPAALGGRALVAMYLPSLVIRTLAEALPDKAIAETGAPPHLTAYMGRGNSGRRFVDIMFANGGLGARPTMDGVSSLGFPANISGVPVEVTENEKPLTFLHKELAVDSGGAGTFRGGLGQSLAVRSTSPEKMTFAVRLDRTEHPTIGLDGGGKGAPASVTINGHAVHPKKTQELNHGDVFAVQCAGGAGHGHPEARARAAIADDLADGYVSLEAAANSYGWRRQET